MNSELTNSKKVFKVLYLPLVTVTLPIVVYITRLSQRQYAGLEAGLLSQVPKKSDKLLLFVAIFNHFSALRHVDRRNALRETWIKICKKSEKVVSLFLTNGQDIKGGPLEDEVRT